jgi:hypothetical protein
MTPFMSLLAYVRRLYRIVVADTSLQDASVMLGFQGTAVYVFGTQVRIVYLSTVFALITIQGSFDASLDETSPVTVNNAPDHPDAPLVAFTALSNGPHAINLTSWAPSTPADRSDLDYALVTVGDGDLS